MLTRVRFGFHIEMCIERCMEAVGYTEKMKFALVGVYEGGLQFLCMFFSHTNS
jgi:hypothetical protein